MTIFVTATVITLMELTACGMNPIVITTIHCYAKTMEPPVNCTDAMTMNGNMKKHAATNIPVNAMVQNVETV